LLPATRAITAVTVNGLPQKFSQSGNYIEVRVSFAGERFAEAQQIALEPDDDGTLRGSFFVPHRIFDQLAARKRQWPIPWTKDDYETTWLAPERLLLFIQVADAEDTMEASAMLDGRTVKLTPAYTSTRPVARCFVGYYADLSSIAPDVRHTIELHVQGLALRQLQGVFFDNVLPQFTESLVR
jgi:hypothetical protein